MVLDLPLSNMIDMAGQVNPFVNGLATYVLFVLLPFNLLKSGLVSSITWAVFRKGLITYLAYQE